MSEIKALEKLREICKYRHLVVNTSMSSDGTTVANLGNPLVEAIDDIIGNIEVEIAANYMLLPVDADGVPIHVGDEMTCHGDVFTVCAVAPAKIHRWVTVKLGEPQTTYSYNPAECTHYKPRTIEDVIEGAINAAFGNEAPFSVIAKKAADEIRELLGGDAE